MGGVWFLARTDVPRRWPSIVALAMLVAVAGGFVLTAATGARRADSALERFLAATKMWDASIEIDYPAADAVVRDVATRPEVAATTAGVMIPLVSEEVETGVIAGLAPGWLRDVYRPMIVAGRLPDPARVDELLVNEDTAERHDLVAGDVVVLEDFLDLGIARPMTIVGIHRGVIDLALADTLPGALATEAFGRRFGAMLYDVVADTPDAGLVRPQVVARMHGDVGDPLGVLAAVADRHRPARPRVLGRSPFVAPIDRTLAVQVEAFWVLAAVAGASALMLLGVAVARLTSTCTHPDATLREVGLGSKARVLTALAAPTFAVIVGTALAVVGALVASPLVPLGSARLAEPDPGVWVDPTTVLVGSVPLACGLVAIATAAAITRVRATNLHAEREHRKPRSTLRLPLPAVLGHDLAYRESGWGRLAVAAVSVGAGLVVLVSVYTSSQDHLLETSSLFGSDYDVTLFPEDDVAPDMAFADIDLDDPIIESVALSRVTQLKVANSTVEALIIDPLRGVAGGTVLDGRRPASGNEVALGPTTAERLGLSVGDDVTVTGARKRSMRIVGEAVLPLQGQGAYGDVMWLAPGAAERLGIEAYEPRLLLNLAEGTTRHDLGVAIGDSGIAVPVPDDVSNLEGVGQIPAGLAIFGAMLGAGVLAFALFGIARRRRHDLAIIRTLGLPSRKIRAAVLTASIFIVIPGVAIGILCGIVLGRWYWSNVAAGVPAIAEPVVPLTATAIVVLGAMVIGSVLVIAPAWLAAQIRPSEILRRD